MDTAAGAPLSTLVLVDDAECELRISGGSLVFPCWKDHVQERRRPLVITLLPLMGTAATTAAIPLVITPPLSSRFRLHGPTMTLLSVHQHLEYHVEFVAPDDNEADAIWDNFQDQVVVQTRLGRLRVRLVAMRSSAEPEDCEGGSWSPPTLVDVKVPSFRLFEQIERAHAAQSPVTRSPSSSPPPPSSSANTTARRPGESGSASFNPLKCKDAFLEPLLERDRRHTPPADERPSSSSSTSGRRASTPRALDPLPRTPPPPDHLTTEISNAMEARAVILRLRAHRATTQAAGHGDAGPADHVAPNLAATVIDRSDMESFHGLVRMAKADVAEEMRKAKDELQYYKSLLPPTPELPIPQAPPSLARAKPARLPSMIRPEEHPPARSRDADDPVDAGSSHNNNQESSPIKRPRPPPAQASRCAKAQVPSKVPPAPEADTEGKRRIPQAVTKIRGRHVTTVMPVGEESAAQDAVPPTVSSSASSSSSRPGKVAPASTRASQVSKRQHPPAQHSKRVSAHAPVRRRDSDNNRKRPPATIADMDAALADFDDSDPDVDAAPQLPSESEDADEDDEELAAAERALLMRV